MITQSARFLLKLFTANASVGSPGVQLCRDEESTRRRERRFRLAVP